MLPNAVNSISPSRAVPSLQKLRRIALSSALLAACLAASGCIPSSGVVAPAPTQTPAPTPAPPPVQQPQAQQLPPAPSNWRDIPAAAGEWRYVPSATGGYASFVTPQGSSLMTLRCVPAQGAVTLTLAGNSPNMRILTDSQQRVLQATASNGSVTASLAPRDNLLDAMMFSRGRFAVETGGQPTLALPAWPEIARVAEDCR